MCDNNGTIVYVIAYKMAGKHLNCFKTERQLIATIENIIPNSEFTKIIRYVK